MFEIKSYGKVNLGLWITEKRADGYHNIFTIFHTISLHDKITIKPSYRTKITTYPVQINQEENIVLKTLKMFEEWTGIKPELDISIQKNIPLGAGLGGGSSNAACVLKFLNKFFENPLGTEDIFKLASLIGADVPFFLKGGLAVGEGIGDRLRFLEKRLNHNIFIIYPNIQIKTADVYKKVTPQMLTKKEEIHIIDSLLGDFDQFFSKIENTLGKIVEDSYPQVKEVMNTLRYLGYRPIVSGSGSSVFTTGKASEKLKKICQIKGWRLIETTLI